MANDREQMTLEPPHPGEFIREDILPALPMTIKDLAKHVGVSRVALSELVNERRGVSIEMAQRLGKAFGNGARFWLDVSPQEVVPGQAEAADWWVLVEASMGPVPVIAMQPWRECVATLV